MWFVNYSYAIYFKNHAWKFSSPFSWVSFLFYKDNSIGIIQASPVVENTYKISFFRRQRNSVSYVSSTNCQDVLVVVRLHLQLEGNLLAGSNSFIRLGNVVASRLKFNRTRAIVSSSCLYLDNSMIPFSFLTWSSVNITFQWNYPCNYIITEIYLNICILMSFILLWLKIFIFEQIILIDFVNWNKISYATITCTNYSSIQLQLQDLKSHNLIR